MNKLQTLVLLISLTFSTFAFSQDKETKDPKQSGYEFTVIKQLPITSIKNQNRSSTCWSFSTISFLESELLRTGKGEQDLSEMFIVSKSYCDKAEKFIRTYGSLSFSPGSSFTDAIYICKNYGIVPDQVMPGLNYGETMHTHGELDAATDGYIKAIVKKPNGKLSTAWQNGFKGIVDAYLGAAPEKFTYNGKEYTPQSYSKELGLNFDDYISITSFTHHPFYTQFSIEVADNWRSDLSYNIPVEEMMQVIDNSINNGYTVLWAADVSEKGFTRKGLGVVPETETKNMSGSDQEKWVGVSKKDLEAKADALNEILPERIITQQDRQIAFDNQQTTDDHGMHIFGIAKDQNGNKYYMVKNSWGLSGDYKGIWYVSETFVKYKTMDILVHKNAIPKELRKKMGIQ